MDPILGIHGAALSLRSARMEVLAANLANADTPGFKARDFDFANVLTATVERGVRRAATEARQVRSANAATDTLKYRQPFQPSMDGNTVEADLEMARFSENAIAYQASLMFVNSKIRGLRAAITGKQ